MLDVVKYGFCIRFNFCYIRFDIKMETREEGVFVGLCIFLGYLVKIHFLNLVLS